VDLSRIVEVEIVGRNASGSVWVIDIAASQNRVKEFRDLNIPVVSVESLTVSEADGSRTVDWRIIANRPLTSPASIWVREESTGRSYQINMTAGSNTTVATIPYAIVNDNDNVWGTAQQFGGSVSIGAVKGIVTVLKINVLWNRTRDTCAY